MTIFNSKLLVYQRVDIIIYIDHYLGFAFIVLSKSFWGLLYIYIPICIYIYIHHPCEYIATTKQWKLTFVFFGGYFIWIYDICIWEFICWKNATSSKTG